MSVNRERVQDIIFRMETEERFKASETKINKPYKASSEPTMSWQRYRKGRINMTKALLALALAGVLIAGGVAASHAAPPGGFGPLPTPAQACSGPAALHNPHCLGIGGGGGGGGGSGGGSSASNSANGGGSHHNTLSKVGIAAIAAVAIFVVYCMVNENEDGTNDSEYCDRQPETEPLELELVENTTNLYARKW